MPSQNVRAFLATGIQSLMPQAERLIELRNYLAPLLPQNLRRSCTIANYVQGKVVIFAENSTVAAKLKLLAPTLRDQLSKCAVQVTVIDIRVQPANTESPRAKDISLTENAARSLAELACQLPDSKLKSTIDAMARRHRGKR